MQNKILKKIILVLVVILSLSFAACSSESSSKKAPISTGNELKVHFIDVGQGDSILVQFKDKNLLIDAGPRSSSNDLLKYLKGINLTKLDYVVATHPHEDHIGGMPEIIKNFEIGEFYAPKKQASTKIFQTMVEDLKKKNHKINVAKAGVSLDMDSDISVEMIAPNSSDYENVNNYSAVIKVTYKDTSFLFTGDAEKLSEKEILQKKYDIKADVLKLGHHGSSTSSSKEFLDKVNPKIAVASLGKNNDYGHPHKEIIKAMKDRKISFYRTDELGTIVLKSDGKNITKE
ncbi:MULTISPECIES: ComEC/Rec2 family competence protein [Clostridium]|uniref:Competence protein ComEC n=1 Tax=Clostridium cadaveris TaxID=1529 RepID=A0A1I2JN61_9CLOT|nr:ComEC/Rec2 family competence protein [Clostridium cadaveris]MDU4951247.1 ComEC/Rec2 family competence protein [Clostridium sp.]MDM8312290.1 ComEC/Rec2 family competence protein [Clostridium cadaveris]MDY4947848.1 ComEC/Rec2 family competence protein [Clostridium cadaveris]NME63909.1 MBL fold metallo-hydrolase [Clostridium cadaveris]NWK10516.1 MBL fold metallo-hydrolase [Clostridium cadaveris]